MTFVLIGLRRSGNFLRGSVRTKKGRNHRALQALFPRRHRLLPARKLLREFRSLGLPPLLFPALQVGRIRGEVVSGCTWCCVSGGFLPSRWASASREGRECLWTLVGCARARLCLFSSFGSWRGCSFAGDAPSPLRFLGCFSPFLAARSTMWGTERSFGGQLPRCILPWFPIIGSSITEG